MRSQVPFPYLPTDPLQMDQPADLGALFHRLNNQLGIILANAELLEAKLADEAGGSRAAQIVTSAVEAIAAAQHIRERCRDKQGDNFIPYRPTHPSSVNRLAEQLRDSQIFDGKTELAPSYGSVSRT